MGWREINMNRRKPPLKLAAIARQPGEDFASAVLRKVAASAIAALTGQLRGSTAPVGATRLSCFLAGYMLGHARQSALAHGVDCEKAGGQLLPRLAAEIARQAPATLHFDAEGLVLAPRAFSEHLPRSRIHLSNGDMAQVHDAGYLVGHLEALCKSDHLMRMALQRLEQQGPDASAAFLTDCDNAADPMQTRAPTMDLRFTREEREIVRKGLAQMDFHFKR